MRVCLLDHHTKAIYLAGRLQEAGFEIAPIGSWDFDVLLVDTDHPDGVPAPHKFNAVQEARRRGLTVGLYPHGGLPILDYDGLRKPLPISFELVHGPGHKRIYDTIGLKRRVEVVGWSYSDVAGRPADGDRTGTPQGRVGHVLFAPIHPWANGRDILDFHRDLNENAYRAFLEHPAPRKTVRMYGEDEPNGVTHRVDGVEYTQSDLALGVDVIDAADAVVSYGTFACTALARGKPTVMIYPYPPHMSDDGTTPCARFDEYRDLTRYPASVGDAPLQDLFERDTSEWERMFVGGPLDIEHLTAVLRQYRRNRAQRRKAAA